MKKKRKEPHPIQDWLDRSNEATLYHVERQGRTGPGLVPFIGAGVSTSFGFKDWKGLLRHASSPRLAAKVEAKLDKGDYERAADLLLQELGPDGFQAMVAASAGDSHLEARDFCSGAVGLLPLLASGPVATTNFDRVLERAFDESGTPFELVISGPRPDLIVDALHGNRRVLIKLHGDWQDRVGRTFAKADYDNNYGKAQPQKKRELLVGAERLLFSSRSLLFIGAGLGPDRTVELLQEVHGSSAGVRHFTITSAPETEKEVYEKERHLSTCGVMPLWYRAATREEHAVEVAKIVETIVERISTRTVATSVAKLPRAPIAIANDAPGKPTVPDAHFERTVRLIEDGRLTFVLGSGIHSPTPLTAKAFYDELARVFECGALDVNRFAVAQYIADRHGREELNSAILKQFQQTLLESRTTHELFAAWKSFRTRAGEPVPFATVITTNYDDVLERRLSDAGLPYHLLVYQVEGKQRGLFYHRSPDGRLRVIERPRNIRELSGGFVVVKLNGGFDPLGEIPVGFATTEVDLWTLAARIPDALPAAVQRTLTMHPLLLIGHGLAALDLEALARFAHKQDPSKRSCAVVLDQPAAAYWRQLGVDILAEDVHAYALALRQRLAANGPVQPAPPSSL